MVHALVKLNYEYLKSYEWLLLWKWHVLYEIVIKRVKEMNENN
jgi:hypothetical protein